MKLSSQEEYGLRCLLHIARQGKGGSLTIPQISQAEGITEFYTAKLLRLLRRGGLVSSVRGQAGGYKLTRPPEQIVIGEVLALLGGHLFDPAFCDSHAGVGTVCTHTVDCSIRSLWHAVQIVVDHVLYRTTLKELISNEQEMSTWVNPLIQLASAEMKSLKGSSETTRRY